MAVRSEELKKPSRDTLAAPLSRNTIDNARPWIRLLLGAGLIAWSSYTTVSGVARDFAPLLHGMLYGVPVTLVGGLGVALFLSFGEWLTNDHFQLLYSGLLIIDARYTQQQIGAPIEALAQYHLEKLPPMVPTVVSFILSWLLALAVARYGEILLFGKRKK
jgi:hypothetical protein